MQAKDASPSRAQWPRAWAICQAAQLLTGWIEDFAAAHQVVERGEGLFHRRIFVEVVDEVEVEAVRLQAPETGLYGLHNMPPRQAPVVGAVAH